MEELLVGRLSGGIPDSHLIRLLAVGTWQSLAPRPSCVPPHLHPPPPHVPRPPATIGGRAVMLPSAFGDFPTWKRQALPAVPAGA